MRVEGRNSVDCTFNFTTLDGLCMGPVILCDEWIQAQVKAFRIMENRSVTWAASSPLNSRN